MVGSFTVSREVIRQGLLPEAPILIQRDAVLCEGEAVEGAVLDEEGGVDLAVDEADFDGIDFTGVGGHEPLGGATELGGDDGLEGAEHGVDVVVVGAGDACGFGDDHGLPFEFGWDDEEAWAQADAFAGEVGLFAHGGDAALHGGGG